MSDPGPRFFVDVLDSAGNLVGDGPLYHVVSAEVTEELDRAGKVAVTVPATDKRAIALLQTDRQLRVRTAQGLVGQGLIHDFTVAGGAQPLFKAGGPSLLGELRNFNTGYETVFENEDVEDWIIGDDGKPETLLGGTGWNPGSIDAALTTTTIGYSGQSVLDALTLLAQQLGRHFRLGAAERTIDFDTFGVASGIRISNVHHLLVAQEDNPNLVHVGDVQIGTISGDVENRIYPLGKNRFDIRYASSSNTVGVRSNPGPLFAEAVSTAQATFNTYTIDVDDAGGFTGGQVVWIGDRDDWSADKETNTVQSVAGNTLTLANPLAFTYPTGTDVVQRPQFYVQDETSIAARGLHEAVWAFPWVQPYTGLSFSLQMAADILYEMAVNRLAAYKDPYKSYRLGELYGLPPSLRVGQTVRFVYRGAITLGGVRTYYVDEDADFYVVKIVRRYHGSGMVAATVEIANVGRPAPSNSQAVTDNVATTRMLAAGESASPAPSTPAPGPSGHAPLTLGADAETLLALTGVDGQTLELDAQAANTVLAGPASGGSGDPDFRALVDADVPAGIARDSEVASEIAAHAGDPDAHHAPVTLGPGSDPILSLNGQELTLGDVATQAELDGHAGNAAAHHSRYTDGEAWAAVLNSDGAGSTLDADLLDGQHASAFAGAGHNHDHGALTGLGDDDHPQYFNLAQNETVNGRPAFNGGVSGSTPPFTVDSTYLIANLNADMLDGQHASAFAAASHTHAHSALTGIGANDHHAQLHAASHVRAGTDEIDGDQVDIDWNPSNYTPATTPSQVTSVDHLTAHLYGIDQALAPNTLRQKTFSFGNNANQGGTSWGEVAGDFYYDTSIYPSTNATWRATIHSSSSRTAYVELYDVTASTSVATLNTTNGTWTHLNTSVSLTNGHYYRIRLRCSESGYYAYMLGSYLEW